MKAFVVYPTYRVEKGSTYVYLYGRQEDGKTFLTRNKCRPYFYIKEKDEKKARKLFPQIEIIADERKNFNDEQLARVIMDNPKDVPQVRDLLEEEGLLTYEADIRFTYRFMMDNHIQGSMEIHGTPQQHTFVDAFYEEPTFSACTWTPQLKILSIDIETGEYGKKLYCIALAGNDGYKRILFVSDTSVAGAEHYVTEKALLEAFTAAVREYDPDIITGWSVIDFDLKVLEAFAAKYHVPFILGRSDEKMKLRVESAYMRESTAEIVGRTVIDGIMLLRISFVKLEDYKLDTAAESILGEHKIFVENKLEQIEHSYKHDKPLLAEYCYKDAELVLRILAKKKIIELTIHRSLLTGMQLDRVKASIASLDSVYLRELSKLGYAARTLVHQEKEQEITGGYVMTSKPGIYDYVIVCDFKSLYPSIMRTINIDPLSYMPNKKLKKSTDEYVVAENGAVFKNTQGILPSILERLHAAREETRKNKDEVARYAIKVLMNSFFGALATPQSRFFSMDVANAITITGQSIIKKTKDMIGEKGYEVIYGDSITGERPVIICVDGKIDIVPIGKLYLRYAEHTSWRGEKEIIDLRGKSVETLSVDPRTGESCFKPINELIRHKTAKTIYRVNQKYGETKCTEDHSLIVKENNVYREVKPTALNNRPIAHITHIPPLKPIHCIDLYELLEHYGTASTYKGNWKLATLQCNEEYIWFGWTNRKQKVLCKRFISFPSAEGDALLELLGLYAAEGSASTPETTDSRMGASIALSDIVVLQRMKAQYELLFKNSTVNIIRSNKMEERTLIYVAGLATKQVTYVDETHKISFMNQLAAVLFSQLGGQTSSGKKIPSFVFHLPEREQRLFLDAYVLGDGSRTATATYSDRYRKKHFRCTTKSLLLASGLSLLLKQLQHSISVRYRENKRAYTISTADKNNNSLVTKLRAEQYEGYVYDLSVEDTHMFADGCGQILLHNTDSIFIHLNVDSQDAAEKIGKQIESEINAFYNEWVPQHYHRENKMELNFDKVFVRFFMPMTRSGEGSKKRYAGMRVVNGKEQIDFTGLEFVRRDWTDLAKEFQLKILDDIFHKKDVTEDVKKTLADLKAGKLDDKLVYRKALRKDIASYTKTTPPHVKAAALMKNRDSNLIEYVLTTKGPQPTENITAPIDYDHYIEKQIKPIADSVLAFYKVKFDDLVQGNTQKSLFQF
jgi:DNA polymerase, archaea type